MAATKKRAPVKKVTAKAVAKKAVANKVAATKAAATKPAATKAVATKAAVKKAVVKKPVVKKTAGKARPRVTIAKQPAVPSAAFSSIAAVLAENPGIELKKMFGCHGLAIGGHFFTFEHDGELVVRLPPARVTELTSAGTGAPFDPGMGRPSRGWLSVARGATDWQRLAEEGLAYAGTLPPK